MKPMETQLQSQEGFDYGRKIGPKQEVIDKFKETTCLLYTSEA